MVKTHTLRMAALLALCSLIAAAAVQAAGPLLQMVAGASPAGTGLRVLTRTEQALSPTADTLNSRGPLAGPESAWTVEQLETTRYFWSSPESLVLDTTGRPHVAYAGNRLYYAWYDGTTWHQHVAVDTPYAHKSALALDAADRPYVCYDDWRGLIDLTCAYSDGVAWQTETVDVAGHSPSLALDVTGRPHVAYHCPAGLCYAYEDGATWYTQTVEAGGQEPSLALDAAGRPHLGYTLVAPYYPYTVTIRYAVYSSSAWLTETVASCESAGDDCPLSLALDAAGVPHLAYQEYLTWQVMYARRGDGGWQHQVVGDGAELGPSVSLVLDDAGLPHVSYADPGNALRYAWYDGDMWHFEIVDQLAKWHVEPSLALDAAGRPQVVYDAGRSGAEDELRWAHDDGPGWQTAVLDVAANGGGDYPSLGMDAAGRPHLSYVGFSVTSGWFFLKYRFFDGMAWQEETVEDPMYGPTALALDAAGWPHIAYRIGDRTLEYAWFDGTTWQTAVVDPDCIPSDDIALVLDSAGRPHIGYYDDQHPRTLSHAWQEGSGWQSEVVDSVTECGSFSLALDALDRLHMTYSAGSALRYAYQDGQFWYPTTLVEGAYIDNSLRMDALGWPHIVYTAAGQSLKHTWYAAPDWHTETVDAGDGIRLPLLHVDAAGRLHVGYLKDGQAWYAVHTGADWQSEALPELYGGARYMSMALGPANLAHLALRGDVGGLVYLSQVCQPLTGANVAGPDRLSAGIAGVYTTTAEPISATLPLFAWDNGAAGPTAVYSWTLTGTHTVAVTASNACSVVTGTRVVEVFCQPLESAAVQGPLSVSQGITALYSVTYSPLTASRPLTATWDNGAAGLTAAYSWTVTGTQTVAVTVGNACGESPAGVTVTVFCQAPEAVRIAGPLAVLVGQEGQYAAVLEPITTSRPLTLSWDNGAAGFTVAYSWSVTGTYTITLAVENDCGTVTGVLVVRVLAEWPYHRYLPMMPPAPTFPRR